MLVYIVFNWDDGILGVFSDRGLAEEYIDNMHEHGFYHKEDCMIKEEKVN